MYTEMVQRLDTTKLILTIIYLVTSTIILDYTEILFHQIKINRKYQKVFLQHVKKMETSAPLGNLKHKKLNMIKVKKLYIIKMLGWKSMISQ